MDKNYGSIDQPLLSGYIDPTPPAILKPASLKIRPLEIIMILLGICGSVGVGVMPLAFYYFFGQLIGSLTPTDDTEITLEDAQQQIQRTAYEFFIIAGVSGISAFTQNFMFLNCGERISARIRKELFKSITQQEISWFDQTETGSLISRLSEDASQVQSVFTDKIGQVFVSLAQFLAGISFALYYSWPLTLVMLATAPFMGFAIGIQASMMIKFTKLAADASAAAVSVAEEVISSFRTVRSFSKEEKEVLRFSNRIETLIKIATKRSLGQGISLGLVQAFIWASCAIAFWFGGYLIGRGDLNFGDLVTVFGMMLFACLGLSTGLAALPEFGKGRTSYNRIKDIVNRKPLIRFQGGKTLPTVIGDIEFENVEFKYPTRDVNVLHSLNFKIEAGTTAAFVGESGSGKSTIFGLVEGFYQCQNGAVKVDGYDIKELDPRWLHGYVSMVSQEPVLFATTIAENISYARENVSMEEIINAAKAANAHDFISKLPDQYNTMVGERGIQLSGGQKQRVAIARAILMNPKILLLDEATSALDTESEALVQEALDRLMVGKTSLVIAHRLATVRNANTIFVLDKGRIEDSGTHHQLLETSEIYANLSRRQLARDARESIE